MGVTQWSRSGDDGGCGEGVEGVIELVDGDGAGARMWPAAYSRVGRTSIATDSGPVEEARHGGSSAVTSST